MYQVRNMTVVVHSFDVFELSIVPFFRFEFSSESGIFEILLFTTLEDLRNRVQRLVHIQRLVECNFLITFYGIDSTGFE